MSTLPDYVEYGQRSTAPGPFLCANGRMRVLLLDGDIELISGLVTRTLTVPAGGAAEYRAVGRRVVLIVGENHVKSLRPPWDGYGWVREALAAFFVPVWAGRLRNGKFEAKRLCMCVPHILVNNAMSLLVGREVYGYPKALGEFVPARGFLHTPLVVAGYGGNFDPQTEAAWVPVLEVAPPDAVGDAPLEFDDPAEVVLRFLGELFEDAELPATEGGPEVTLPNGISLAWNLIREFCQGNSRQVFLKQFRAAEFGGAAQPQRAAYQAVLEVPTGVRSVKPGFSKRHWDVTIHPVKSHPIAEELGVENQTVTWSVELLDFDFVVEEGVVIGR
jgi:hypothetical protein